MANLTASQRKAQRMLNRPISRQAKIRFFKKQVGQGKRDIKSGFSTIKKNLGKPKSVKGLTKIKLGNLRIKWASRKIAQLKKRG